MGKRVIVTVLCLTWMAWVSEANTNQVSDVRLLTTLQNEAGVDHMRIANPAIKELLKDAYRKMKASDAEIQAFAERNGTKREKQGLWTVFEMCETNNAVTFMRADFLTETGPIHSGAKVVYKDNTHKEELKQQRYQLGYYENGKIELFRTAGDPAIALQFYPSGRIKLFCLSAADNTTIAVFDGGDDDSIKHEVYNGGKTDKDKGGKP